MKLSEVRIFGFKTFADRTELKIGGDLIAVVGPNGCGKSNLVDAILWGLGESNARNLRANTGQDVIFAGSGQRKALGFAEVSLHFDNTDGTLPVDAAEVVVTRRLTRSGESEYQINRRSCRQKDVFDLLADTGLGKSGYAIVGQKEIDAALSASAEERRAWIDEAAGVQRYRAKRIEALRRLATAKTSLERIDDILNEIEIQRGPLKEQAELAQRYREIIGTVQGLEVTTLAHDVAAAVQGIAQAEARRESAFRISALETQNAEELDQKVRETGEQVSELESELDGLRELVAGLVSSRDRLVSAAQLAAQKLESLDELETTISDEHEASEGRIAAASDSLIQAQREEEEESQALERFRQLFAGVSDVRKELVTKLRDLDARIENARKAHAARLEHEAEARSRKKRISEAKRELEGIEQTLPDLAKALAEAIQVTDALNTRKAAVMADQQSAKTAAKDARLRLDDLSKMKRIALAKLAELEGRMRGIEATIDAHEGVAYGPKAVLVAADAGQLTDQYTPVASAIDADADLALAIETALGGAQHDLIVDHDGAAKRAIQFLKEHRLGRATFQPISLMRPYSTSPELRRLVDRRGVVGIAADLVRYDRKFAPVIQSLLGRILVCETLDDALEIAKTQGWSRLVTLDGEVVHSSGAVAGGTTGKPSMGIVQRKAELATIADQVQEAEENLERIAQSEGKLADLITEHDTKIAEIVGNLATIEAEVNESRHWLQSLQREHDETERDARKRRDEIVALDAPLAEIEAAEDPEALEAERLDLIRTLAKETADSESSEARFADAQQRVQAARRRVAEAESRLESATNVGKNREQRIAHLASQREGLKKEIDSHSRESKIAEAKINETQVRLDARTLARRETLELSFKLAEAAKQATSAAREAEQVGRSAEIELTKAESRRANAMARLLEEYGVSEPEALEIADTHALETDSKGTIQRLRQELKTMGDVNLGAIEAYQHLSERFDSINYQREDILDSKTEIERCIRELDQLTRGRFLEAFEKLQVEFTRTFRLLFEGGDAEITLSDPDHVLESGADIEVTIPGKKRQRLELLSGGERAMAACAFLFALLAVKPSPLVVLDEVDAPLDGRNVERFVSALSSLTENTQFIIITHNELTIESTSMWFGVTMKEPGVTTVVPFHPEHVKDEASQAYLR